MSVQLSEPTLPTPKGWREVRSPIVGRAFLSMDGGLTVIVSEDTEESKRRWLHVSMSRRGRMPTYDDLATVKRVFIGDRLPAYQIFPVRKEHVNLHEFCLHLWAPLDDDPLAELSLKTGAKR